VAPERFQIDAFRQALTGMVQKRPVSLIVVDEAHCVSEWGHDFRTAYLRLGRNARQFCSPPGGDPPPLLALTGTASSAVLKDLQRELDILEPGSLIVPGSFDRPELRFVLVRCGSAEKQGVLLSTVNETLPRLFEIDRQDLLAARGPESYCGLVFCPHVNGDFGVDSVARLLKEQGITVARYSGAPPKSEQGGTRAWSENKRKVERAFRDNKVRVLACTKAFGMGIDKRNVRFTAHYGMPPSIEAYYQEAGRAARDRDPDNPAWCFVLLSDEFTKQHGDLLSPATPLSAVRTIVKRTKFNQADDVVRALWFHTNSFKGVEYELEVIDAVLSALCANDSGSTSGWLPLPSVRVAKMDPRDDPFSETERALHRLVVIGVVADYRVEYASKSFVVHATKPSDDEIIDSYVQYVDTYERKRALEERALSEALSRDNRQAFIRGIARLYLEFVYDVVENQRRTAIANMLAACDAALRHSDVDEMDVVFRERILQYLESTEFTAPLEEFVGDEHGGLGRIGSVLEEVTSPEHAGRLRGTALRLLEAYPDQPALLLLRALAESYARDVDWSAVRQNLKAFIQRISITDAGERMAVVEAAGAAIDWLEPLRPELAAWLENEVLHQDGEVDRDLARAFISVRGMRRSGIAPWSLLLDVSTNASEAARIAVPDATRR